MDFTSAKAKTDTANEMQTFYLISLEMQRRTLANYFFIVLLSISPGTFTPCCGIA